MNIVYFEFRGGGRDAKGYFGEQPFLYVGGMFEFLGFPILWLVDGFSKIEGQNERLLTLVLVELSFPDPSGIRIIRGVASYAPEAKLQS